MGKSIIRNRQCQVFKYSRTVNVGTRKELEYTKEEMKEETSVYELKDSTCSHSFLGVHVPIPLFFLFLHYA